MSLARIPRREVDESVNVHGVRGLGEGMPLHGEEADLLVRGISESVPDGDGIAKDAVLAVWSRGSSEGVVGGRLALNEAVKDLVYALHGLAVFLRGAALDGRDLILELLVLQHPGEGHGRCW